MNKYILIMSFGLELFSFLCVGNSYAFNSICPNIKFQSKGGGHAAAPRAVPRAVPKSTPKPSSSKENSSSYNPSKPSNTGNSFTNSSSSGNDSSNTSNNILPYYLMANNNKSPSAESKDDKKDENNEEDSFLSESAVYAIIGGLFIVAIGIVIGSFYIDP